MFNEWQKEKRSYLRRVARLQSGLSAEQKISRKPRDPEQYRLIKKLDKARARRLEEDGKMVWTGRRELRIKVNYN